MKKILFYLFLFLTIFSCKKEEKIKPKVENQPLLKNNNDTIFIKEKCAVFISATETTIENLKKTEGEENFYIGADDYYYYKYQASEFLKKQKLKIYNIIDEKIIVFKSEKGNFTVLKDTIKNIGSTYFFEPNKHPKKVYDIEIDNEYKNYFGKKDSLIFSKKEQTVRFFYNAIACSCAQWSKVNDKNKYSEKFFLIDGKNLTQDAEDFWDGTSLSLIVEATGTFSENQSVPKDFSPKGDAEKEKARIFKYRKIRLVQLGNKKY